MSESVIYATCKKNIMNMNVIMNMHVYIIMLTVLIVLLAHRTTAYFSWE